ncbi:MAG TPA: hypothetical protein VJ858_03235 [Acidimicrobiia bacterium]|nr:hypothetical protein [Acidimicrobiia bacterium]
MSRRSDFLALVAFGAMVAVITATGIGVRATYGAQTTADEPQYLLSALSLWEDGDLDISDELAAERYRHFHEADLPEQTLRLDDGRRVSPHDPLLPVLLAVPMGLGGWVAAKALLATLAGVLAAGVAWAAIDRFAVSRPVAFLTAGLFALAPPLAVYSTQAYPELVAALAVLIGFTAITGSLGRGSRIVFLLAVIALPWLAIKYVPVAAALTIAGLIKAGRGHRLGLVATLISAGVVYVFGHVLIYDGLTAYATGDHFVGGEFTAVGSDVDLWGRSTRLIGLMVDRGFGIAAWQPAFLLLPIAVGWGLGRRLPGVKPAVAILGTGWLVATFMALTMHGWWFPGRQLVAVLPIAILLIAAWADDLRRRLPAALFLGAVGVLAFAFLVIEGLAGRLTWVVDFGSTQSPVYQVISSLMPDYMTPTTATWVLHGIWAVVVVLLGWIGWRSGVQWAGDRLSTDVLANEEREQVLT